MPLSNYLPSSRLIQPGVCTSSTRPASPFQGQCIYETDTNRLYVWNGSSWVIPNQTTQNPEGLEFLNTTTFATAASVTVDSVFSSTYDNYKINISLYGSANDAYDMVLRTTTDDTANSYYRYGFYWTSSANNLTLANDTKIFLNNATPNADYPVGVIVEMFNPNVAKNTTWSITGVETNTGFSLHMTGVKITNTQYTGFKLQPRTGTSRLTGTVTTYGYRK